MRYKIIWLVNGSDRIHGEAIADSEVEVRFMIENGVIPKPDKMINGWEIRPMVNHEN